MPRTDPVAGAALLSAGAAQPVAGAAPPPAGAADTLTDLAALEELALALARGTGARAAAQALLAVAVAPGAPGVVVGGPETTSLPVLATTGLPEGVLPRAVRPCPAVEEALRTGEPQTARAPGSPALGAALEGALGPQLADGAPVQVVPLSADGRTSGVLIVERAARSLPVLQRAAEHAALALRSAWLLEQLSRLAATDGLTKIANRRTFETTLEREVARAVRSGDPLTLVLLDLDHFKQLNDTHGHPAGDEVLRNAAFALTCECRDFDTPARYGGEEFAVLLPGCGAHEAVDAADRLRRAVSAAPAPAGATVTASAGVATFPEHAQDAEALVRTADEALYRAKAAGRDRSEAGTAASADVPPDPARTALLARLATPGRTPGDGAGPVG